MKTFLALHQIASQRGDGLKSELARLLESTASAARTRSNVLSQTTSYLTIDEHNIVVEQDNSMQKSGDTQPGHWTFMVPRRPRVRFEFSPLWACPIRTSGTGTADEVVPRPGARPLSVCSLGAPDRLLGNRQGEPSS